MSTNGLLLPKYADRLAELGVNSVTHLLNMKGKFTKDTKPLKY